MSSTFEPPPDSTRLWLWRRIGRLSVREMMLLVLLVGGSLGWQARRASIQRRAVAALTAEGIGVSFDYEYDRAGSWLPHRPPWAPGWLRRAVGEEWFREVASVDFNNVTNGAGKPSEDAIRAVATLDRLDKLRIYNVPISDSQLSRMLTRSRPRQVLLQETAVTPAALSQLAALRSVADLTLRFAHPVASASCLSGLGAMTELKGLWLTNLQSPAPSELAALRSLHLLENLLLKESPRDETCLEHLRGLTGLRSLVLQQTKVTDAGLQRLVPLRNLQELLVDGSAITDAGVAAVAQWPALNNLSFHASFAWGSSIVAHEHPRSRGGLTDAALQQVARLSSLKHLSLAGSRFTDVGLADLGRLPALTELSLTGVEATQNGVRQVLANHQFGTLELTGPTVADDWLPLLANQKSLILLAFGGPQITDAGMAVVVTLPTVLYLDFTGSRLTDRGLMVLAASTRPYRILSVRGTEVTEVGVAAFRAAHPGCKLIWDPPRMKD